MTESWSLRDHELMAEALRLGATARFIAPPNPAVGCVIASSDRVLGRGATRPTGAAHAEITALADAADQQHDVRGATVYVTLEPCSHVGRTPPCTDALIKAGVSRVVVATQDPDPRVSGKGCQQLRAAGIQVETGLLENIATDRHRNFMFRCRNLRPWVRVKIASSLDGHTALASGESVWITGPAARRDVQFLRAEADCVMTGSGTVLCDDPSLDVRLTAKELQLPAGNVVRQPLRAILDSAARTPPDARLFQCGGELRIYTSQKNINKYNKIRNTIKVIPISGDERGKPDLGLVLSDLGALPVNLVHVEAGPILCGALLKAGLVDEIVVYLASHIMGSEARPQFVLPGITNMDDRLALQLDDVRRVGDDLRLTYGTGAQTAR